MQSCAVGCTDMPGDYETVVVDDDSVKIYKCDGGNESQHEFQRYWVRIILEPDRGWYPSRLFVSSHGKSVKLAA